MPKRAKRATKDQKAVGPIAGLLLKTPPTLLSFERSEKSLFASFEFLRFAQEDNHAVVYIA